MSVFGHLHSPKVQADNLIASAVAMLIDVASIRGVYYIAEQPRRSKFFVFPSMDLAIRIQKTVGLSKLVGIHNKKKNNNKNTAGC